MTASRSDTGWRAPSRPGIRARNALVVIFGVNGLLLATWASRIPAIADSARLSDAQLGLALLAPAIGALVAFELSGRAVARYGSAPVTVAAAAAFCLTLPPLALADHGLGPLFVALLLLGIANGAVDVAQNTHGVAVEQAMGRPALSGMHAAFSAGGFLGAGLGAVAAGANLGVGLHFTGAAVLALAATLLTARHLPLRVAGPTPASASAEAWAGAPSDPGSRTGDERPHAPAAPRRRGLGGVLPGPVLLLGVIGFACMLGEGAALDWSAKYMRDSVQTSPALAALAYAGFSAAMFVGRVAGDRLRARTAARRLLPTSAALAMAGLLFGLAAGGPVATIVGFTLFGAGLAVMVPIVFATAGQLPLAATGMPPATALARVTTLSYLGFLAGPALVGVLAGLSSLRVALLLPVALLAIIIVLARPALRTGEPSRPLPTPA